ncbi:glutamate racemase [Candidatus Saccharibacteria bacterium]|nr:glutamate racemase [Candidatus Saccharibacteria bacterium]
MEVCQMITVGVFDSGVGGKSVVNAIEAALPDIKIVYAEDKENVPYGTKNPDELYRLVLPILNMLSKQGCDVIIIACNTVTTTIIERLRLELPLPLIGIEPMVKPAAEMSKTGIIAMCATPTTLQSARYAWLKENYAKNIQVLEPDCSDWASLIETDQLDHEIIKSRIEEVCKKGADAIVLGCTHYHWIEHDIQMIADEYGAIVIQPEKPIIEQLKKVLSQLS